MKIAVVGDTFLDEYIYGEVKRLSPEAPIPVFLPRKTEIRPGGAANVANNLFHLGLNPILYSITSLKLPFEVRSPIPCKDLKIIRYVSGIYTLLRVDEPEHYLRNDLNRMVYPNQKDFDIIAFIDYDMGIISGGSATIVDTMKTDLLLFKGSRILKVNNSEYSKTIHREIFPQAFITNGEKGINYYEYGKFLQNEPTQRIQVVDEIGAGDTVTAILIYCLAQGIKDPKVMMKLANKAAAKVISKFGTTPIEEKDLI